MMKPEPEVRGVFKDDIAEVAVKAADGDVKTDATKLFRFEKTT